MIEFGLFAICMAILLSFLWGIGIGLLVREAWLAYKYGWKYEKKLKILKIEDYEFVSEEEYVKREKRMDKILKKYEKTKEGDTKNAK